MPAYFEPGLYVAEIADRAKLGVPVSIDDRTLQQVVADLRKQLASVGPDWTEHNQSDPGVALLEMLAWLGEQLSYRADGMSDRAAVHASRLAAVALALLADRTPAECSALKSVRFFRGFSFDLERPTGG